MGVGCHTLTGSTPSTRAKPAWLFLTGRPQGQFLLGLRSVSAKLGEALLEGGGEGYESTHTYTPSDLQPGAWQEGPRRSLEHRAAAAAGLWLLPHH